MLTSFEIENFKGIKSGKMEDLSQVNILVGRNNSGKSTILDALLLLRVPLISEDFLDRDGLGQVVQRRVRYESPIFEYSQLWYQMDTKDPFHLTGNLNSGVVIQQAWKYSGLGIYPATTTEILGARDGSMKHSWNSRGRSGSASNIQSGSNWGPLINTVDEPSANFLSLIHILEPSLIHQGFDEDFWFQLAKNRTDRELIKMLNNIYRTNIENLSFSLFPPPQRRLVAALPETSVAVDWFGDGFRYAINILSFGVVLERTALLVEELETHQHPESLRMLIDTLFELAKQRQLQLFLTSHSMELMSYSLEAAEQKEIDLRIHHVRLDEEGNFQSTPFTRPNAELMLDIGHDPRLHDKYLKAK